MTEPASLRRSATFRMTFVASLLALTACADPSDDMEDPGEEPTLASVEAVSSPAGVRSGEPRLEPDGRDGLILSWLEPVGDARWALRFDRIDDGGGWRGTRTVVERDDLFVNWADVPGVWPDGEGGFFAFWLQRGGAGGYDYGVRVARSTDGGGSWSRGRWLHDDRSPVEHGFVAPVRAEGGAVGAVWLDGRRFVASATGPATEEMALRTRWIDPAGPEGGSEILLDGRTCDCCPTDAAPVQGGAVVVYRDRSADEIRDIYRVRLVDGRWTDPAPVHRDGWRIEACPVNGPAVAAEGRRVAAAWFTAAADEPSVLVAFSNDAGESFGAPVRVDGGNPAGRADVVLLDDGSAVVSWIERRGVGRAELVARRVDPDGSLHGPSVVAPSSGERASGFPRMARLGDGLLFAWTHTDGDDRRVRVARATLRPAVAAALEPEPLDANR